MDAIDQRCISMFNFCLAQLKRACLLHNWVKGLFSLSTSVYDARDKEMPAFPNGSIERVDELHLVKFWFCG